jgi:hypothetical protein
MTGRPLGARPEAERSDWTEQDLLTVDEALPRLDAAMAEVAADLAATTDPELRGQVENRLAAMEAVRARLTRPAS